MNIVLIGAPASGKGSQAKLLERDLNIRHISTGDMFRAIMQENSDLGREVKFYMDKAMLVPDEVTLKVVKNRLKQPDCANGVVFDGFPRTLHQAKELDKFLKLDAAIYLKVGLNLLIKRAENRLICPKCHKIFIKDEYKREECDMCGEKLVKRKDDQKETVEKRYEEFRQMTLPLTDYYRQKNILTEIVGEGSIQDVYKKVKDIVKDKKWLFWKQNSKLTWWERQEEL